MREQGKRLPCLLPYGSQYLEHQLQFVHVDDVARLLAHILHKEEPESQRLTVLNVAGRGEALTIARCMELAQAKLIRVPGKWTFRTVLQILWKLGISAIPPEALPYMTSEYIMDTAKLQAFLGPKYQRVIQYTVSDAFTDSFAARPAAPVPLSAADESHTSCH
jgi:nucleoside-diphosphate-sugar epimerase